MVCYLVIINLILIFKIFGEHILRAAHLKKAKQDGVCSNVGSQ